MISDSRPGKTLGAGWVALLEGSANGNVDDPFIVGEVFNRGIKQREEIRRALVGQEEIDVVDRESLFPGHDLHGPLVEIGLLVGTLEG